MFFVVYLVCLLSLVGYSRKDECSISISTGSVSDHGEDN